MEKKILDQILVPSGLIVMVAYHLWLLYRIIKHPTKTVIGVNSINRRLWVQAMMEVHIHTHTYIYIYISLFISYGSYKFCSFFIFNLFFYIAIYVKKNKS
jgi:multisubunit Na+/H+ antiporter MnhF subunit